ncbi:hypothetical protein ENBRE01_0842 [Enteropsectra breve]|nr:hypothetical protein ENBRE01_0842 [Enteropsectra breve]
MKEAKHLLGITCSLTVAAIILQCLILFRYNEIHLYTSFTPHASDPNSTKQAHAVKCPNEKICIFSSNGLAKDISISDFESNFSFIATAIPIFEPSTLECDFDLLDDKIFVFADYATKKYFLVPIAPRKEAQNGQNLENIDKIAQTLELYDQNSLPDSYELLKRVTFLLKQNTSFCVFITKKLCVVLNDNVAEIFRLDIEKVCNFLRIQISSSEFNVFCKIQFVHPIMNIEILEKEVPHCCVIDYSELNGFITDKSEPSTNHRDMNAVLVMIEDLMSRPDFLTFARTSIKMDGLSEEPGSP